MRRWIVGILLLLVLAGSIGLGFLQIRPEGHIPVEDRAAYEQVILDLEALTDVGPRVAGSPEGTEAKNWLVNKVEALGLSPEILPFQLDVKAIIDSWQADYDSSPSWRNKIDTYLSNGNFKDIEEMVRYQTQAGDKDSLTLNNVLVKVEVPKASSAIMLVSHYDSVAMGPGAADDGLAVTGMLQVLKEVLAQRDNLKNNVYFLFTDGEEQGLLGAADFVQEYPQYQEEIKLVMNFEARGNSGALLMFETSNYNYELVKAYAANSFQPTSTSVATAVYKLMPNGTDFTEFINANYQGLNFAMIEGAEHYHKPTDTVENLAKDTAFQYYKTIQSLTSAFAQEDLSQMGHRQEGVFFTFGRGNLMVMPAGVALGLSFLPLLLALVLLCLALFYEKLRGKALAKRLLPLTFLGGLPVLVGLFFLPGSYLFFIPALGMLMVQMVLTWPKKSYPILAAVLLALTLVATVLLFTPIVFLIQVALGYWYITLVLALVPFVPLCLYAGRVLRQLKGEVLSAT